VEELYQIVRNILIKNKSIISQFEASNIKNYASKIVNSKLLSPSQKKSKLFQFLEYYYSHLSFDSENTTDDGTSDFEEKQVEFDHTPGIYDREFSFQPFIKNINVRNLIEKNIVFDEYRSREVPHNTNCLFCKTKIIHGESLKLTDLSYICEQCFENLQNIKYPEKYQKFYEKYIANNEAYKLSKRKFLDSLPHSNKIRKLNSIYNGFTSLFSLLLFVVVISLFIIKSFFVERIITLAVIISLLILLLKHLKNRIGHLQTNMDYQIRNWINKNREPKEPILRSFYDPNAVLSDFDKKVLHVFNYWPGYPPFWDYLRNRIIERDDQRCQVTGCPSRTELHLHHKTPVSNGGSHVPENLVTLCSFHHGLQPDLGHERIWGKIKTDYFTLVSKHSRHYRAKSGKYSVRAHLRRLELISIDDLKYLNEVYKFSCPNCNSLKLSFRLNLTKNLVVVSCKECGKNWNGPQELTEETGPRLAEILKVTQNQGTSITPWEVLSKRTRNVWGEWKGKKSEFRKKVWQSSDSGYTKNPTCPECGAIMKLVKPRSGDPWNPFWGCSKFSITGCKGSMPYKSNSH
jgi:transcription elongation factor Elf1